MKLPISKLNYPSQPINDDTFFVVDKEVDGTWKSYKVRLSTIGEYINTIDEQPEPIIPADDGDEFEFNVAGSDNVRTLRAGTWECTIVGGGGGMFSQTISNPRDEHGGTINTVTRYRGHSSPMIKGTFTLNANTPCKFHVGDLPTIGSYSKYTKKIKKSVTPSASTGWKPYIINIITTTNGEELPTDNDGDSYVYDGDPSYILIGNQTDKLTTDNSIVAVKAQKWYISTGSASNKNTNWGWQYWDAQANPYNTRFSPTSDKCENGANGKNGASSYAPGNGVSQGKTTGTNYGKTPSMTWTVIGSSWDETCGYKETYGWVTGKGTGGYIHVKRIS